MLDMLIPTSDAHAGGNSHENMIPNRIPGTCMHGGWITSCNEHKKSNSKETITAVKVSAVTFTDRQLFHSLK